MNFLEALSVTWPTVSRHWRMVFSLFCSIFCWPVML